LLKFIERDYPKTFSVVNLTDCDAGKILGNTNLIELLASATIFPNKKRFNI
jgi:hypothetical protein